jgi:DNA-binding NtrC family response regulator
MPERVLLVDDEVPVLRVLERALRKAGMVAVGAISGEEGLKLLTEQKFDAALIDKNLPGMDGVEVIRHARKRQPQCACILMTGLPSLPSAIEAIRLGVLDYVQKPSPEFDIIHERIRAAIEVAREVAAAHQVAALRKELERKEQLLSQQTVEMAVSGELSDLKAAEEGLIREERALRDQRLLDSARRLLERVRKAKGAEKLIADIEAHLAIIDPPRLA